MDAHTIPAVFTENASYACEDMHLNCIKMASIHYTREKTALSQCQAVESL